MKKYYKYPLYKAMHENWTPRKNAIETVRISCMASMCEDYAEKHPQSPFYAELMALAVLYDDCDGSPFWQENFKKKFSNKSEVIRSFRKKADVWIAEHDEDVDIYCIRAALTLLTKKPYDQATVYEVGKDLYKVMISDVQTKYEWDWCNVALGADFTSYLEALKKGQGFGGCYIATAIYGSYDCPEVWILRRFRDDSLAKSIRGRVFIKSYYIISPMIVKLFGGTAWFQRFWKGRLDKIVQKLRKKGYEDTPYCD